VDFVVASTPREMHDAFAHYLAHEAERREIADRGRRRVLECLEARSTFGRLLAGVSGDIFPRYRPSRGLSAIDGLATLQTTLGAIRRLARR
jgi:spore maturation protein CgeB